MGEHRLVDPRLGTFTHYIKPVLDFSRSWDVTEVPPDWAMPQRCETRLPAVVCACGLYLIDEVPVAR